jgi:hypothetical protein
MRESQQWRTWLKQCRFWLTGGSRKTAYLLAYLRNWTLLEKLPMVQPLKNFPAFYGTRRFTTVSTRALHWSWARPTQSIPSHSISLRSVLISFNINIGLPSGLFIFLPRKVHTQFNRGYLRTFSKFNREVMYDVYSDILSKGVASHVNARATLSNGRTVKENGGGTVCMYRFGPFCIFGTSPLRIPCASQNTPTHDFFVVFLRSSRLISW